MSTININLRDKVYQAIDEFNKLMLKPYSRTIKGTSLEYVEKRGMFYTILRRNTDICLSGDYHRQRGIKVDDIACQFREDGTLKSFKINRNIEGYKYADEVDGWDRFYSTAVNIKQIQHLTKERQEFYRTPEMNEIADIVNSIK